MYLESSMKGQGQIQMLMIALILILFVVIPTASFLSAINTEYGMDNSSMTGIVEASDELYVHTYQLQNSTQDIEEDPASFIMTGFTGVASIILGTVTFINAIITEVIVLTGFNLGWMLGPIILVVLIVLIFAVINFLRGGGASL